MTGAKGDDFKEKVVEVGKNGGNVPKDSASKGMLEADDEEEEESGQGEVAEVFNPRIFSKFNTQVIVSVS